MKDIEEKVLHLLAEICEDDIVKQNKEIELFETGLIDSLVFAELLIAIEDNFSVSVAPSEIERSDMNTPQKMIDLIRERSKK